jgi:hypothetical protein
MSVFIVLSSMAWRRYSVVTGNLSPTENSRSLMSVALRMDTRHNPRPLPAAKLKLAFLKLSSVTSWVVLPLPNVPPSSAMSATASLTSPAIRAERV